MGKIKKSIVCVCAEQTDIEKCFKPFTLGGSKILLLIGSKFSCCYYLHGSMALMFGAKLDVIFQTAKYFVYLFVYTP